jgi:uncharacterized protein (TIGR00255 family)
VAARRKTALTRAVNSRGLDLKMRLPWADGAVEERVRDAVARRVARGRVEVAVRDEPGARAVSADVHLAAAVQRALDDLGRARGIADREAVCRLVAVQPAILGVPDATPDTDVIASALAGPLEIALDALCGMRAREGAALSADLDARAARLQALAESLGREAAGHPAEVARLLGERLARLLSTGVMPEVAAVDAQRVAQEVALLAERADVTEEIVRLRSHLGEVRRTLAGGGEIGRKLDFLLQEVQRELSTVGAKSQSAAIATLVVEARAEVDRMREQAANLE